jgi:hypothetical protein
MKVGLLTKIVINFSKDSIFSKSGFLDFVHRLYFNKITTFWKLDLVPSSGKKEEQNEIIISTAAM